MADTQLAAPNYLTHAFKDQHNLVLLFGAACFSLAFASPSPLLVGAAGELLWLSIGPRLPAFRDWVDRQLSAEYLTRSEAAIEAALGELSEQDESRFRALSRNATELLSSAQGRITARDAQLSVHGLLELRRTFLDYLFLAQRVVALIDPTPNSEREQETTRLQRAYGVERELTARMTIRNRLNALQRQIEQQTGLATVQRNLEHHLEMLEGALLYLRGRVADPALEALTSEIDSALAEIGPAERFELTVDEILEPANR